MFAQHKWECANQGAAKLGEISPVERTNQSVESCLYRLGSKFDPAYERNQPKQVTQRHFVENVSEKLAEREGFEPPMPLRACRISSAVHSTTLPPLRLMKRALVEAGRM